MAGFDDALGRGADGSTYRAPTPRPRTTTERVKAWAWYRWGVGHRPAPRFEGDRPERRVKREK